MEIFLENWGGRKNEIIVMFSIVFLKTRTLVLRNKKSWRMINIIKKIKFIKVKKYNFVINCHEVGNMKNVEKSGGDNSQTDIFCFAFF